MFTLLLGVVVVMHMKDSYTRFMLPSESPGGVKQYLLTACVIVLPAGI